MSLLVENFRDQDATRRQGLPVYRQLTDFERIVLQMYLPVNFSREAGTWSNFHFDFVPPKVRDEVQAAMSLQTFRDLQIWTVRSSDEPSWVVGNTGNQANAYSVVRWGKRLLNFNDITEQVFLSRLRRTEWGTDQYDEPVLDVARQLFLYDPLAVLEIEKASRWKQRHCGKPSMLVHQISYPELEQLTIQVCSSCGEASLQP